MAVRERRRVKVSVEKGGRGEEGLAFPWTS